MSDRLREVARETLRWFEEVDGIAYRWDDDEGAQAIMRDLAAAMRAESPQETCGAAASHGAYLSPVTGRPEPCGCGAGSPATPTPTTPLDGLRSAYLGWCESCPCACEDCVELMDAIDFMLRAAAPSPEAKPPTPPCGGSRCWQTPDGTSWVHSSKSYDSCSVNRGVGAEAKPEHDHSGSYSAACEACNRAEAKPPTPDTFDPVCVNPRHTHRTRDASRACARAEAKPPAPAPISSVFAPYPPDADSLPDELPGAEAKPPATTRDRSHDWGETSDPWTPMCSACGVLDGDPRAAKPCPAAPAPADPATPTKANEE